MAMLEQTALLALLSWSIIVVASSAVNQTTGQEVSSMLSVTSAEETRRVRRLEAEMETLRRMVTDLKAAGPCTAQQSPQSKTLNEVTQEIQALRSQFQVLQMQRELSALRSDILPAKSSMLADTGSQAAPVPAGRTAEDENEGKRARQNDTSSLSTGALYVRWGHERCPNDTEFVYSGIIGGSSFEDSGPAANALCLPLNPVLENQPLTTYVAIIQGAEFQASPLPPTDLDPLCAVCRTPRPTVLMLPAATSCHPGWTMEHSGYLMAGSPKHKAASEYICIDSERRTRTGSVKNDNGKLFYYVTTECGSLPCPPYQNGKVLPCVVCSK